MIKLIGWAWRLLLVIVVILGLQIASNWWWKDAKTEDLTAVEIPQGSGVTQIAYLLEEEGVIKKPRLFLLYAKVNGAARNIHAGNFALPKGEDFKTLIELLQNSESQDVEVVIPEGFTVEQMADVMEERLSISKEAWLAAARNMEGYLFPDTYRFAAGVSAQDVVNKMRSNFDRRIEAAGLSPSAEQIIIASILEKEVRTPETMANVSDIIRKRLAIGMALQMDSTVNYVTNAGRPSATYQDIEVDSPYNTYKYPGLPPGPIGNPGINAIRAAMNPTANSYYYFLTDPQGNIYYAETFEQHVANRVYLR